MNSHRGQQKGRTSGSPGPGQAASRRDDPATLRLVLEDLSRFIEDLKNSFCQLVEQIANRPVRQTHDMLRVTRLFVKLAPRACEDLLASGPVGLPDENPELQPGVQVALQRLEPRGLEEQVREVLRAVQQWAVYRSYPPPEPLTWTQHLKQTRADWLKAKEAIWTAFDKLLGLLRDVRDDVATELAGGQSMPANTAVPPVVIGDRGANEVLVNGKPKYITASQMDVIAVLCEVFPGTLTKDALAAKSNHGDAVNMLKRIAKSDTDLKSVIKLAGETGGGYGLRWPESD